MSLVGNLKEMPLSEVLQFLGGARSSGKLSLTSVDGGGLVVFRNGLVIYAASNSVRETLGSLLVYRGGVDPEELQKALATQHRAREERRLGSILVEQGAIEPDVLEETIRSQVRTVIHELASWDDGFFRFEPMEIAARGEIEVDARDFLLAEGLDAASLTDEDPTPGSNGALGAASEPSTPPAPAAATATANEDDPLGLELADEPYTRPEADPAEAGFAEAPEPFELESEPEDDVAPELVTLKAFMSSPMSPWFTGEVALAILRCAQDAVRRCVLFSVRGDRLVGMGGFGVSSAEGGGERRLREVSIPLDEPSVLAFTVGTGEAYRGTLHETDGDRLLVDALGSQPEGEVVALPLTVSGRVVAVLYGDGAVSGGAIGRTRDLENVLREAGLAMARGLAFEPTNG